MEKKKIITILVKFDENISDYGGLLVVEPNFEYIFIVVGFLVSIRYFCVVEFLSRRYIRDDDEWSATPMGNIRSPLHNH